MPPWLPLRSCASQGCPSRVEVGQRYCATHKRQAVSTDNRSRGAANKKVYDAKGRALRFAYLSQHPLCVLCEADGRVTAATVVDHVEPVALRPDLRLAWENLRALCAPCHNAHTARTRGWGRRAPKARA